MYAEKEYTKYLIYLKSAYVVVISIQGTKTIYGFLLRISSEEGSEGDTEGNIGVDSVWSEHAEVPTDDGTQIVSHQEHFFHTQRIYERNHVTHEVKTRVAALRNRGLRVAVASEIRRHRTITERTESQNLVAPGVP